LPGFTSILPKHNMILACAAVMERALDEKCQIKQTMVPIMRTLESMINRGLLRDDTFNRLAKIGGYLSFIECSLARATERLKPARTAPSEGMAAC